MATRLPPTECFLDVDASHHGTVDRHPPMRVQVSIAFDLTQDTAHFQLRATLSQPLTDFPAPHSQYIHLDIPPEKLASLSYCRLPDLPREVRQRTHTQEPPSPATSTASYHSSPCVRLTFNLAQPALLIIPPNPHLGELSVDIRTPEDRQVFEAFRSISKQAHLSLVLYSTELLSALTADQLDELCSALSSRCLKFSPHNDVRRLYKGRGGTIVAPDDTVQYSNATAAADNVAGPAGIEGPPSYQQTGPAPPLAPLSPEPRSAKRARASTPSTESSASQVVDIESLSIFIQRAISSSEARIMGSMAAIETRMAATETRMAATETRMAATEARLQELSGQIGTLRQELAGVDEKLGEKMTAPQVEALLDHRMELKSVDFVTREELEAQVDHQLELKSIDFVTAADLEREVMEQVDLESADLVTRTDMEAFVEERLEVASDNLRDKIFDVFDQ